MANSFLLRLGALAGPSVSWERVERRECTWLLKLFGQVVGYDLDFFTPVLTSWSGQAACEGIKLSRINRTGLGGKAGFAALSETVSLPLFT